MYYIDDIHPVRTIDYEKYRKYLNMRKERERILKESRYVCHSAWNIHRKLYEERFKKVYLYIGRGNGHWRTIDRYLDLLESGRDVEVMNFRDTTTKTSKLERLLSEENYIFDPCWEIRSDGTMHLREVSLIPNPRKGR